MLLIFFSASIKKQHKLKLKEHNYYLATLLLYRWIYSHLTIEVNEEKFIGWNGRGIMEDWLKVSWVVETRTSAFLNTYIPTVYR